MHDEDYWDDDDGRSYDYPDWDDEYDYDDYDSDEDVSVTLSFNLSYEIENILNEIPEQYSIDALSNNIIKYIDDCCNKANAGKKKPIVYRKDDFINFESYLPWNVLWRNQGENYCEEGEEEIANCFDRYFNNNVYISVGHSLSHLGNITISTDANDYNIRIRRGKVNVSSFITILYDKIMGGEVETYCYYDEEDLKEIAREGINDWRDYDRSRNEAADAYFHG